VRRCAAAALRPPAMRVQPWRRRRAWARHAVSARTRRVALCSARRVPLAALGRRVRCRRRTALDHAALATHVRRARCQQRRPPVCVCLAATAVVVRTRVCHALLAASGQVLRRRRRLCARGCVPPAASRHRGWCRAIPALRLRDSRVASARRPPPALCVWLVSTASAGQRRARRVPRVRIARAWRACQCRARTASTAWSDPSPRRWCAHQGSSVP
jgi:hypothetical protein